MTDDLLYCIALTMVSNIGAVHANELLKHYGSARQVLAAPKSHLAKIQGIGTVRSAAIKSFNNWQRAETELKFIQKHNIQTLVINSKEYPKNLAQCYDAPTLLFYKGSIVFNQQPIVSVVGTRNSTDYGKEATLQIITALKEANIIIASGLAYGIDSIAHKTSLQYNIPTVGIVAHGLDRIYPQSNKTLAKEMLQNGGLLTEFFSGTNPDKQNFPRRNRIVAGICDALVVVETSPNGGSIITAELANDYGRDVFAIPGKITATQSAGCHQLIRQNKAALISSGEDLIEMMNWKRENTLQPSPRQKKMFHDLSTDEQLIIQLLEQAGQTHIDEIKLQSGISSSKIAAAILRLEMEDIIASLPGKQYRLQ